MKKFVAPILIFLASSFHAHIYAQCGPVSITVTDYCPDQYAEFTVNDADPNTAYQWFSANSTDPGNDLGYGVFGDDGKYFTSTTTLPTGSGTVTYYYQQQIGGITGGPNPTGTVYHNNPIAGISNGYETRINSTVDFVLNTVTIPMFTYYFDPTRTYVVQVEADGTFAQPHYFTINDVTRVGTSNVWLVTIPIDINGQGDGIPVSAGNNIPLRANSITDGTGEGMDFAPANITSLSNSYDVYNSGGTSIVIDQDYLLVGNNGQNYTATFYDWEIDVNCDLEAISASEQTDLTQCCTPVTTQPTLATQSGETVFESPFSATLEASNSNAGHYYVWYLDGTQINQGAGLDAISITSTGRYTVRVVEDQADVDRASCYNESAIHQIKEQLLFAQASATTICLGESVSLTADGSIGNTSWTPTSIIADPSAIATIVTPTQVGDVTISVSALVPEGNVVENSDFEDGATGFTYSAGIREAPYADMTMSYQHLGGNLGSADHPYLRFADYGSNGNGVFAVTDTYLGQGGWVLAPECVDHTSGSGFFYLHDALETNTMGTYGVNNTLDAYVWSQDVVVQPNTDYDFSAWFGNASTDPNSPPEIQFYIDDQPVGSLFDPAANTTEWGTCDWHEHTTTWNSGNTTGTITLKIIETTHAGIGNDFIMDDIYFSSGNGTQTDDVTITVQDCFDLTVQQNNTCPADSIELEATTNGLIDRWTDNFGNTFAGGTTLWVNPGQTTTYTAHALFPLGNLVNNGDFELGNQSFTSDLNYGANSVGPGGYGVATDPSSLNGFFLPISDHTSGSGNMGVFDAGSAAQTVWATTVTVENGKDYAFSVWIANINSSYLNPPELQFVINGVGLDIIDFPENTSDWFQFSETWTSTVDGPITIELVNANGNSSGNDFAMDDVVFAPLFDEERTVDIVVNPCCTAPGTTPSVSGGNQTICEGNNASFSATAQAGLVYQWQRDGVDIAGETGTVPAGGTITLSGQSTEGDYRVIVAASSGNLGGCYDSSNAVSLTVNPTPDDPTISDVEVCAGQALNVSASSSVTGGGTIVYTWDGPGANDGTGSPFNVSASAAVSHAGTYTVTVTAAGCPADNTGDVVVTVNDVPADPAFSTSTATVCQSTNAVLYEIGSIAGATGYTWNYTGTGATINGANESVTLDFSSSATSGDLEVYATNACGNSNTISFSITVDAPAAFTTEPVAQTACEGTDVIFTSAASGPGTTSYQWYGPSGVLAGEQGSDLTLTGVTSADAGSYYVEFTASCGAINSATAELTVNSNTTITVHPASNTQCEGNSTTFSVTASGTAPISYAWDFNSGTSVGIDDASLTVSNIDAADAGTYGVTVTGGCGPAVSSNLATLTVNTAPTIDTDPVNLGLCAGSDASFNVVASGTPTLTYQWQKDGNDVASATSDVLDINSIVAGDAGDYTVIVTNGCGSVTSAAATLAITTTEFPSVSLTVSDTSVCENETVVYTAVGNATGSAPTYDFVVDGIPQGAGATNTFTTSPLTANTTVSVVMTSNSTCIDGTATNPATSSDVSVTVVSPPSTPVIDQADQQICVADFDLSIAALTFGSATWSTDAGTLTPATGETTSLNIPNSGTTATVTVTVSNGPECPTTSDVVVIERVGDMTSPEAGADRHECEGTDITLAANSVLQAGETGTWTLPAGVTFANGTVNDFDAEVSAGPGSYTLTWTIDNGGICPPAGQDMEILIDEAPSNVTVATSPITTCAGDVTLNAATPTPGTAVGTWSIQSQPGSAASITDVNDPTSTASIENGTTTFLWTVVNGTVCPAVDTTLVVDKLGDITSPRITLNGGVYIDFDASNQEVDLCANTSYTLTGASPDGDVGETGIWAIDNAGTNASSALGSVESQNLALNAAGTQTVLSWTIDNPIPTCAPETRTVTINVFDPPVAEITNVSSNDICEGEVVTLTANATNGSGIEAFGGTVSGTAPNFSLSSFSPGSNLFSWTVSNDGCPEDVAEASINMTENVTPNIGVTSTKTTYCLDPDPASVTVSLLENMGTGSVTWTINGGAPATAGDESGLAVPIDSEGSYVVEATLTSGITCVTSPTAVSSITINAVPGPSPSIDQADMTICETNDGVTLTVSGTGSGSYQWFGPDGAIVGEVDTELMGVSQAGSYHFVETDANCGDIVTDTFTLNVDFVPEVSPIPEEITVFVGEVGNIAVSHTGQSIVWQDAPYFIDDTSSVNAAFAPLTTNDEGEYNMTIVSTNGECQNSAMATVIVRTPVVVPNLFSPNNDDINDLWSIKGISTYSSAIVKVYNRWGSLVYERYGGYDEPWDGTRNGKELPSATYYYVIDLGADDINGQFHKGDVTIVR